MMHTLIKFGMKNDRYIYRETIRSPKQGGGVVWSQPPLNFGWGGGGLTPVNTPPDLRRFLVGGGGGGVGSPQIDLTT